MRFAKSLRYPGDYVDARKCDRESYLRLGLVCNVCNCPVFFVGEQHRNEHQRKTKKGQIVEVKSATIEAFLSHFETDKNSASCVARQNPNAAAPTKKQVKEGKELFRKQSLEMFKNHFLAIVSSSSHMIGYEQDITFYKESLIRESSNSREEVLRVLKNIEMNFLRFYRQFLPMVKKTITQGYEHNSSGLLLEEEMNIQVALEALDFLGTSPAKSILSKLFFKACSEEIQSIASVYDKEIKNNPNVVNSDIKVSDISVEVSDSEGYLKYLNAHWADSTYSTVVKSKYSYKSNHWNKTYEFALSYISAILLSVKWGEMFDRHDDWLNEYNKKLDFFNKIRVEQEKVEMPVHKRALGIYHYTLVTNNTNNVMYQPISLLSDLARDELMKVIGNLKAGASKVIDVPGQKGFQTKINVEENKKWISIEIYKGKAPSIISQEIGTLIIVGVIVWKPDVVLSEIKFSDKYSSALFKKYSAAPQKTISAGSLPLLCVGVCESEFSQLPWMASYEYCLALTLLQII